ncbi:MAG: DUF2760 domain-containing protein [Gammaproteobacteria bacterium]|nr:DUF2760 domain-containing protein [Gammaproteobacteria bacterium]
MDNQTPSFITRIVLALSVFFRILFDPRFALGVLGLKEGKGPAAVASESTDSKADTSAPPPPPRLKEAGPDAALQLLGLLQQEGRFIDFIEEDVVSYADADIGAAARVVHEGCRKAMREHLTIAEVRSDAEGSRVTLAKGFDATAIRLTGNVVGEPPFTGVVTHKGWRATEVRLPKLSVNHDVTILAPAEVEL